MYIHIRVRVCVIASLPDILIIKACFEPEMYLNKCILLLHRRIEASSWIPTCTVT